MKIDLKSTTTKITQVTLDSDDVEKIIKQYLEDHHGFSAAKADVTWDRLWDGSSADCTVRITELEE